MMRPEVFGNLDTRKMGRRKNLLLADFSYQDRVLGPIVSKAGNETDFATIDDLLKFGLWLIFAMLAGWGDRAATIHDFLYGGGLPESGKKLSRKEADEVLYRALLDEGCGQWRAWAFFIGVRAFGKAHWKVEA